MRNSSRDRAVHGESKEKIDGPRRFPRWRGPGFRRARDRDPQSRGDASTFIVNANADNNLITLRYRLRRASFDSAEEPFEAEGKKFNRGSFIIRNASTDEVNRVTSELGIQALAVATAPTVKAHPVK